MQNIPENNAASIEEGLVIANFGHSVAVQGTDGQVFQCHLRRNQPVPVVGDRVKWQLDKEQGVVLGILPRRSELARGNKNQTAKKVIAANLDLIAIVLSPPPIFSDYLVDRYLIAAELLAIPALIVINKIDLVLASDCEAFSKQLNVYNKMTYPVIQTSTLNQSGMKALSAFLEKKTAVLVGPSGVGKSSIIKSLGGETVRVGEVSAKGIGKHTTTASRFYQLNKHIHLIDSPGVREFNLWPVSAQTILDCFKDITPHLSGCRFRDCKHQKEPDCSVQNAVTQGKISAQRLVNYHRLVNEYGIKNH